MGWELNPYSILAFVYANLHSPASTTMGQGNVAIHVLLKYFVENMWKYLFALMIHCGWHIDQQLDVTQTIIFNHTPEEKKKKKKR